MDNNKYNVKEIPDDIMTVEAVEINASKVAKLKEEVVSNIKKGWSKLKSFLKNNLTVAGLEKKLENKTSEYKEKLADQVQQESDFNKAMEIATSDTTKEKLQDNFDDLNKEYQNTNKQYQKDMDKIESQYNFVETAKDVKDSVKETTINAAEKAIDLKDKSIEKAVEVKDKAVEVAKKTGETIVTGGMVIVGATIIGAEKLSETAYKTKIGIVNVSKDCLDKVQSLKDKVAIHRENKYKMAMIKRIDKELLQYREQQEKLASDVLNIEINRDKDLAMKENNLDLIKIRLERIAERTNKLASKAQVKLDKYEQKIEEKKEKQQEKIDEVNIENNDIKPDVNLSKAKTFIENMEDSKLKTDLETIAKKNEEKYKKKEAKLDKAINKINNKFNTSKMETAMDKEIKKFNMSVEPLNSKEQELLYNADTIKNEQSEISSVATDQINSKAVENNIIDNQIKQAQELREQLLSSIEPEETKEESKTR